MVSGEVVTSTHQNAPGGATKMTKAVHVMIHMKDLAMGFKLADRSDFVDVSTAE